MRIKHLIPAVMAMLLMGGVALATYHVGDHVSDFTLPDAYGVDHSLYDYEGMVIVLNFWDFG